MKNMKNKNNCSGCLLYVVIICLVWGFISALATPNKEEKPKETTIEKKVEEKKVVKEEKTPEQIEKEKHDHWISAQFSAWDGSHRELVKMVKKSLNDEKSFEHVETKYMPEGDDLIITMQYTAKNGFNATIKDSVKAKATYADNMLKIIE